MKMIPRAISQGWGAVQSVMGTLQKVATTLFTKFYYNGGSNPGQSTRSMVPKNSRIQKRKTPKPTTNNTHKPIQRTSLIGAVGRWEGDVAAAVDSTGGARASDRGAGGSKLTGAAAARARSWSRSRAKRCCWCQIWASNWCAWRWWVRAWTKAVVASSRRSFKLPTCANWFESLASVGSNGPRSSFWARWGSVKS